MRVSLAPRRMPLSPARVFVTAVSAFVLFAGEIAAHAVPAPIAITAGSSITTTSTAVGSSTNQIAVTFNVTSGGTLPALSNSNVLFLGASKLDFTLGTGSTCTGAVSSGSTCTVYVNFSPKSPGMRMGAVNLVDSSGNLLATTYVSGVGTGPEITYMPGTITTVAGGGTAFADGGAATATSLANVKNMVVDGFGNLFIPDASNNRVRKVAFDTGIITTVVGTGTACTTATAATAPCGDGGTAISAQLKLPTGIALDGAGNIYIADTTDQRIRKVTLSTGIITTVAGNGTACAITSPVSTCGDGTQAANGTAELRTPNGVAVDAAGNVYIADYGYNRIRKVTTSGVISTVAGNGSSCSAPAASPACGDTGQATNAQLGAPYNVAFDSAGDMFIADNANFRIRKVTTGGLISTVAGNGNPGYADGDATTANPGAAEKSSGNTGELWDPQGVAVDAAGNVYIGDYNNSVIRKLQGNTLSTLAGTGAGGYVASQDGGPSTSAQVFDPVGITLDSAGNIYFADSANKRIRKISAAAYPLNFGQVTAGSQSATQTVAVNNIGNSALTLTNPSSGQNPSVSANFLLTDGNPACPMTTNGTTSTQALASGASCQEVLSYKPVTSGSTAGNLIFSYTNGGTTQTALALAMTGTTSAGLSMDVIGQNIPQGTASITLEFIVGYGANGGPVTTSTPTLTVGTNSASPITCIIKAGHNNCTAPFNPSALGPGTYTITATQPADANYSTASVGTALLTVVPASQGRLVNTTLVGSGVAPTANVVAPKVSAARVTTGAAVSAAPAVAVVPMASFAAVSGDSPGDDSTKQKKDDAAK